MLVRKQYHPPVRPVHNLIDDPRRPRRGHVHVRIHREVGGGEGPAALAALDDEAGVVGHADERRGSLDLMMDIGHL